MEELKNPKTVKEVFKDYNSNSFELSGAKVIGVNLYKKKRNSYKWFRSINNN